MKNEAMNFYQSLFYTKEEVDFTTLSNLSFPSLSADGVSHLLAPVNKDEVFYTLQGMKFFNSLGIDGFHAFFFKKYWHVVGDEVWKMVHDAFTYGFLIMICLRLYLS